MNTFCFRLATWVLLLALAAHRSTSTAAAATVVYVSSAGVNTGDCISPASPCATFTFAISNRTGDITVMVWDSGTITDFNIPVGVGAGTTIIEGNALTTLDCAQNGGCFQTVGPGRVLSIRRMKIMRGWDSFGHAASTNGGELSVADSEFLQHGSPTSNFFNEGTVGCTNGGKLTVSNCFFHDNWAFDGGALAVRRCNATISNSNFTSNIVSERGGAVSIMGEIIRSSRVDISSCRFTNNQATSNGGAISILNPGVVVTVTSSVFSGNKIQPVVSGKGRDVYVFAGNLFICATVDGSAANLSNTDSISVDPSAVALSRVTLTCSSNSGPPSAAARVSVLSFVGLVCSLLVTLFFARRV